MNTMNGGTRTKSCPAGEKPLDRELIANLLADRVAELCLCQHLVGGFFTIENPQSSYVWLYKPFQSLLEHAFEVVFDQCMYGLQPPHCSDLYIKKPTKLLTNYPGLRGLAIRCDKTHKHYTCLGDVLVDGKRVKLCDHASMYPQPLCARWAKILVACNSYHSR